MDPEILPAEPEQAPGNITVQPWDIVVQPVDDHLWFDLFWNSPLHEIPFLQRQHSPKWELSCCLVCGPRLLSSEPEPST